MVDHGCVATFTAGDRTGTGVTTMRKKQENTDQRSASAVPVSNTIDVFAVARRVDEKISADDQEARDASLWLNLASMGNQWARALTTGNVFNMTDLGLGLVRSLLDIEQAQMRALRSIDENVRLLKDGPAKTGRILLEQAQRASDPERAEELINEANKKFYDALPLASDPREAVVVKMHLGVTALRLGYREESQDWLSDAYMEIVREVLALAERTGNVKVIEGKMSYVGLLAGGVWFVALKKLKGRKQRAKGSGADADPSFSRKSEGALRELLPVVTCLAVIHNAALLDEEAERLPALKLEPARKKKTFELVQVAATVDDTSELSEPL